MKPEHIFLVRHGQSEGNVNKAIYSEKPDYALELTPAGIAQADQAGEQIAKYIGVNSPLNALDFGIHTNVQFYFSPLWRTRRTFESIAKHFSWRTEYEDPRLREQEWGHLKAEYSQELEDYRDSYGHFYYRFPDGESCADVYDRVSDFFNTLHRDFEKPHFPRNTIIVTHGMTMRVFLMRWFHLSVESFELLANPHNCEYYLLKLNKDTQKYSLATPPRMYDQPKHQYQYKWAAPRMNLCFHEGGEIIKQANKVSDSSLVKKD